jgi:hypothetical protein
MKLLLKVMLYSVHSHSLIEVFLLFGNILTMLLDLGQELILRGNCWQVEKVEKDLWWLLMLGLLRLW